MNPGIAKVLQGIQSYQFLFHNQVLMEWLSKMKISWYGSKLFFLENVIYFTVMQNAKLLKGKLDIVAADLQEYGWGDSPAVPLPKCSSIIQSVSQNHSPKVM